MTAEVHEHSGFLDSSGLSSFLFSTSLGWSAALAVLLGAALRRGTAAAASRAGLRGGLHPAPAHGSAAAVQSVRCYSHGSRETDEEFDAPWVSYFNKSDIDAWELREGMNTLVGYDLVPEPKITDAALRACRWFNDFASAVRILEVVKDKAGPHKEIYPYVIQELRPTLNEFGISTPEKLDLDKV
ncbi:cytochrome c oxidase subunit 5A, mitochondrial-like [Dasypus novemcinctus]|uniref:cytochrome c oxidase subunit 5A, mitochondrial-like n=1 Tax=Dasypus novemcinctus TaxID=9361 RepID=UPI0039C9B939